MPRKKGPAKGKDKPQEGGSKSRSRSPPGRRNKRNDDDWRQPAPDASKQLATMLKLVPILKNNNFDDWDKGLQIVAAQYSWYDHDSGDEWSPLNFNKEQGENAEKKAQRMTAYTIITKTANAFKYLYEDVKIGDAAKAYKAICSLMNRSTVAGLIEASESLYSSSMVRDKVTVGEFAALISSRAKLVRKRGGTVDEVQTITLLLKGLLPEFKTFKDLTLSKSTHEISFNKLVEDLHDFARNDSLTGLRHGGKSQNNVFMSDRHQSDRPTGVCRFYVKGNCTRGKNCKFAHIKDTRTPKKPWEDKKPTNHQKVTNCPYCMQPGHKLNNCFKRRSDQMQRGKDGNSRPEKHRKHGKNHSDSNHGNFQVMDDSKESRSHRAQKMFTSATTCT